MTADPTLLPVATTTQLPLISAYNALNVPALAHGQSYLDPTTGVKVWKLSDPSFPTANAGFAHDYADGNHEVSLPHTGQTRTILVCHVGQNQRWLIDFNPGTGFSNPRNLYGTPFSPPSDIKFTFSSNPATPYYAYVFNSGQIKRIDIRGATPTEAPGGGWPLALSYTPQWLHQSKDDEFFTWMDYGTGRIYGYEPSTQTLKYNTASGVTYNEPRIDREGRYVGISLTTPQNGLRVWDWVANTITWGHDGYPDGPPFAHNASLRRRWMGQDWDLTDPGQFWAVSSDVVDSDRLIGGPGVMNYNHGSGNWVQRAAVYDDQWALCCGFGVPTTNPSNALCPGGMLFFAISGGRRLLGHHYNTASTYELLPFCKLSPDGLFVLFTSNMNGQSRTDVFLAEVPSIDTPADLALNTSFGMLLDGGLGGAGDVLVGATTHGMTFDAGVGVPAAQSLSHALGIGTDAVGVGAPFLLPRQARVGLTRVAGPWADVTDVFGIGLAMAHGMAFDAATDEAASQEVATQTFGFASDALAADIGALGMAQTFATAFDAEIGLFGALPLAQTFATTFDVIADNIGAFDFTQTFGFASEAVIGFADEVDLAQTFGFASEAVIGEVGAVDLAQTFTFGLDAELTPPSTLDLAQTFSFDSDAGIGLSDALGLAQTFALDFDAAPGLLGAVDLAQTFAFSFDAALEPPGLLELAHQIDVAFDAAAAALASQSLAQRHHVTLDAAYEGPIELPPLRLFSHEAVGLWTAERERPVAGTVVGSLPVVYAKNEDDEE